MTIIKRFATLLNPVARRNEAVHPWSVNPKYPARTGRARRLTCALRVHYSLGNLHDASLADLAANWRIEREPSFRELCRRVHAEAVDDDAPSILNWYKLIQARAGEPPPATLRTTPA